MIKLLTSKLFWIVATIVIIGVGLFTWWVSATLNKASERDDFEKANKSLIIDKNSLKDSVRLYKELSAKNLLDRNGAFEMQGLKQAQIELLQGLIKPMRDSVLAINKRLVKVSNTLLETQKDLGKCNSKKKGLFR